jgi:hypothetical protein
MKNRLILIVTLSIALILCIAVNHLGGQTRDEMLNRVEILEKEIHDVPESDTVMSEPSKTDTTSISIANRQILIIDKDGKTDISIYERTERDTDRDNRRSGQFRGNWRGLELGLNNYVNKDFSVSLDPGEDFMELRAARSRNINLNLLQYNLTVSDNNIGFVTGLGFEFNNYRFSDNVSITKENKEIVPVNYDEAGIDLDRTRFRAIYLNVPLLFELQTNHNRRSRRAYVSAGVIGGVNIGSSTRVVYKDNSSRGRERVRDDFYLSPFRYGLSFRTGYRSLNLYANYYPTPLFQKGKGPELYPFAVGFSILGF